MQLYGRCNCNLERLCGQLHIAPHCTQTHNHSILILLQENVINRSYDFPRMRVQSVGAPEVLFMKSHFITDNLTLALSHHTHNNIQFNTDIYCLKKLDNRTLLCRSANPNGSSLNDLDWAAHLAVIHSQYVRMAEQCNKMRALLITFNCAHNFT